jgi:hypothetical protein
VNPAVEGSEPSGHPNASVTRDGMGAVRKTVAFWHGRFDSCGWHSSSRSATDSTANSGFADSRFDSCRERGAGLAGREAVRKTAGRVQLPPRLHGSSSKGIRTTIS